MKKKKQVVASSVIVNDGEVRIIQDGLDYNTMRDLDNGLWLRVFGFAAHITPIEGEGILVEVWEHDWDGLLLGTEPLSSTAIFKGTE